MRIKEQPWRLAREHLKYSCPLEMIVQMSSLEELVNRCEMQSNQRFGLSLQGFQSNACV